ncbi:polysaccharide lyase family 7 protein [Alteromonas sp. 5E99-2]|uniref:polysaccharide lyase family 7 protein n=1 Tax=Alteromonas sp. 5E99-2 TaxID=2817683 RepID=UPI001A9A2088|nr:polysaccharide lyase family 7 protein [Alteromonas sp. 5E99-2]MBO1256280.1 polysaccharide lyase family 7 protein [Alteromonas sp. 5E99-2]
MIKTKPLITLCTLALSINAGLAIAQTIPIESVGDFGGTAANFPPENAVDGNTDFSSRWAAELDGDPTNIFVDFGSVQRIDDVGIAWGRGDERTYRFEIRARAGTSGSWTLVFSGTSSGTTDGIETYNVTDMDARQVRIKTFENSAGTDFTNITEFEVYGAAGRSGSNAGNNDNSGNNNDNDNDSSVTDNSTRTVLFEKNGFSFSIDGAGGAQEGIQLYLWNTNENNENQHWVESQIDNSFYQYRKANTDLCWDGGDGGEIRQAIRLAQCDVDDINQHWELIDLPNGTVRIKKRGVSFSIDGNNGAVRRQVIYLWNSSDSNVNQQWSIIEVDGDNNGTDNGGDNGGDNGNTDSGEFNLDPNLEPWENFDLSDWVIDTPAFASDGESQRFGENDWDEITDESREFFFTHTDGGMRFVTRLDGARTSTGTSFVRSELREMLRAGRDGISTIGLNENNWVLGYQPTNLDLGSGTTDAQDNTPTQPGGRNGVLTATLRVNRVTTTGTGVHVGRTIIGQIHADDDEPVRLYYRKEPNATRGCIYAQSEIRNSNVSDVEFPLVGDGQSCDDSSNGIALDELFSYKIENIDEDIIVTIYRGDQDGQEIGRTTIDLNELGSGYDRDDEWMYFKLGAYTQNNRGDDSDGDVITFYRLNNTHDNN